MFVKKCVLEKMTYWKNVTKILNAADPFELSMLCT